MPDVAALVPPVVPVVGLGASAGGLGALQTLFGALLPGSCSGLAFVLVQHLSPDHPSLLAEILARITHLRVREVTSHERVEAGCLYVIPPNRDLALTGGTLVLSEPKDSPGHRRPIDFFLLSLAQDQQEQATAIILSGTGSDGAAGLRAIKQQGGLVIAQLPASCEFPDMPAAAIATGLVDFVLPPAEMPAQLDASIRRRPTPLPDAAGTSIDRFPKDVLALILGSVRTVTGHDFTHYKPSTIVRRVERRMALHHLSEPQLYVRLLEEQPAENTALFKDLLIGVTSFFRDPAAFEELGGQTLARFFERRRSSLETRPIRAWVPGCSSGEEAYSITILLEEQRRASGVGTAFQVFATDLDAAAIEQARAGQYPASIAAEIEAGRLARFFTRQPGSGEFRINKEIRSSIVFSQHNVLKDPPFSRLDLISCRNLMIYLDSEAQRQLLHIFHYALNPGGLLFLGTSETTAGQADLFTSQDRKSKLYVRNDHSRSNSLPVPRVAARQAGPVAPFAAHPLRTAPGGEPGMNRPAFRERVERALVAHYAAVGVLVDDKGDILYLHGRTGLYLEPAPGDAGTMNIRKMAREGLRESLATSLLHAASLREPVHVRGVRVKTNGDFTRVDLSVLPLPAAANEPALYLAVLVEAPPPLPAAEPPAASAGPGADARIAELSRQLQAKEEYLRASSEELEAANEELRSANEELQSVNEELQSANEELETSQEELQSVNEELTTVNAELQQNLKYLSQANNDMNNLLAGTDIGTIFVDHDLRILRFTPSITKIVNLIPSDVGRPVGHLVSNLQSYNRLVEDLQTTLNTLVPMEVEVRSKSGSWYLMRIRPYRTLENVIEGAVITFTDVTELRRIQDERREADVKFRVLFESMPQAALFFDSQGAIAGLNAAAAKLLGLSPERATQLVEGKLSWKLLETSGNEVGPADQPAHVSLRTGQPVTTACTGVCISDTQEVFWVRQEALPLFRLGDDKPFQVYVTLEGLPGPARQI